jgi:hypothetical protein
MARKKAAKKNFRTVSTAGKKFLAAIAVKFKFFVAHTATHLKAFPVWLKSRPQAFRHWRAVDKKKKKYRSFRLQKKIKPVARFIPSVTSLFKLTWTFFWRNKKILLTIMAIHFAAYYFFGRSAHLVGIETIQDSVRDAFGGQTTSLSASIATLGVVLGVGGSGQTNAMLVTAIIFTVSLAYVWAIRKLSSDEKITARDAFYQGLGPIVPVVMLLVVMSLQLLPFAMTSFVYTTARTSGLFASGLEDMTVFVFSAFCGLLSFYFMTSTIVGLYIATLPGMRPLEALRAAKKMVQFQRFAVFKRIIILPIVLSIVYLCLLLCFIRFIPSKVLFVAETFQIIILPFIHIYLYKLYRSLI